MTSRRYNVVLICALAHYFTSALATPVQVVNRGLSATIPIKRRTPTGLRKRQSTGAIGLGDSQDTEYSVEVKLGSTLVPVILDTGSSDLWSISTDCTATSCGNTDDTPQISTSSFKSAGLGLELNYGDSSHPTSAVGTIVSGDVSLAGIQLSDHFFGAVNKTNTNLNDQHISGIFGIGFPDLSSSVIFQNLVESSLSSSIPSTGGDSAETDAFISSLPTQGPFMGRLITGGKLKEPMYTLTLQREAVEVGGNIGQLTIGQLPDGVSNDSLTWVPVRLYTETEGGLPPPSDNPNEVYPSRWEVPIDDVTLNGQTLPKPSLEGNIGDTALIDSGTSFLAGPQIVVSTIYSKIGVSGGSDSSAPTIPCNIPVNLSFTIGGKVFPIDPRDFLGQQTEAADCNAGTLLPTDPPSEGSLMSWILGDPFMKSNLVAFYFGNLTHPSVDPPRMGFLSTVPSNANDAYSADVQSASHDGGQFLLTSVVAPTGTFAPQSTNSAGVGQAATGAAAAAAASSAASGVGGANGRKNGASKRFSIMSSSSSSGLVAAAAAMLFTAWAAV